MTQTFPDFDTREDYLEDHWSDEAACDGDHAEELPCSVTVTHRVFHCLSPNGKMACLNLAEYTIETIESDILCGACWSPARSHWRVIPA